LRRDRDLFCMMLHLVSRARGLNDTGITHSPANGDESERETPLGILFSHSTKELHFVVIACSAVELQEIDYAVLFSDQKSDLVRVR
jgi:hypothetical protein